MKIPLSVIFATSSDALERVERSARMTRNDNLLNHVTYMMEARCYLKCSVSIASIALIEYFLSGKESKIIHSVCSSIGVFTTITAFIFAIDLYGATSYLYEGLLKRNVDVRHLILS